MGKLDHEWPVFAGDYLVNNPQGYVAIATLKDSPESFRSLLNHNCVAIMGSIKTENLGIEKVIANVISNPYIRYIVICGEESRGHFPGQALISLFKNGIEDDGKIIGARGAIPYLENVGKDAVKRFREQVIKIVDMIGSRDIDKIEKVVEGLEKNPAPKFPKEPMIIKGMGKKESTSQRMMEKLDKLVINEFTSVDPRTMEAYIEE